MVGFHLNWVVRNMIGWTELDWCACHLVNPDGERIC